ncbi:Lanthionine synthetase C-like protein [Streptomyces zhaozhouensis]|uniref:Lanthionine synthetase C-like protein n=1 Tax=Streptomyces zhaozhouensis TaxID=1300267 RepID=A0A286EA77_9ACTN|nr:lanthionine synthetase C family protein [Streptomyces zhaozhouensis]SOD67780.1 Lanthionine synthetase C-like protein [Streptomyces zhaozhouensis]
MIAPPAPRPASAAELSDRLAHRLEEPEPPPAGESWRAHSLSQGTAGIALLHTERAHRAATTWRHAHRWISAASAGEIDASDDSGLFHGVPAVAFLLNAAAGDSTRYRHALATSDHHVERLARHRAALAIDRLRAGGPPSFREFDIFHGLTGIGAHLLHRDADSASLRLVLDCLVALTRPLRYGGATVPGWWVGHDPRARTSARYPDGHGNQGAAHGIAGPLMLLAHTARRGITVEGQYGAIATIQAWFDRWRQHGRTGSWWPEHLTLHDLRAGHPRQRGPARPSWCYGTPGIARALQLAALATGDTDRQRAAERHLLDCLTDPAQLARLTDSALCHGWAGVYQTVWRAAQDAVDHRLHALLPRLAQSLRHHVASHSDPMTRRGFLDGGAGTALALATAATGTAPISGWDRCLLII